MIPSYPGRFFTDFLFSSLVSFVFFSSFFCVFFVLCCYLKKDIHIYILIYIWLFGRVSDKKKFIRLISGIKKQGYLLWIITDWARNREHLSVCMLKLPPEFSTLPSLVGISVVKVKIHIFKNAMLHHIGHMSKGSCGFKDGSLSQ